MTTPDAASVPRFLAGAGRATVAVPPGFYPFDGFDGEHDPLHARVLVVEHAAGRVALVVLDQTSIIDESLALIRQIVSEVADVGTAAVVVAASHTFSAPHLLPAADVPAGLRAKNDALRAAVGDAVRHAAGEAARTLRPARSGSGRGTSRVNVNRDVRTADGWWLGADEDGPTDTCVDVIRIDGLDGRPIAVVVGYAVQSSVLNGSRTSDGRRLVSADLAGAAVRHVERHYGDDVVTMFLTGAAGDQAPFLCADRPTLDRDGRLSHRDLHEAGFLLVDLLGERLGAQVVRVADDLESTDVPDVTLARREVRVQGQVAPLRTVDVQPTHRYDFRPAGASTASVTALRLGRAVIVGFQVELNSATGVDIKTRSPFDHTIVATVVDGAAKYMADASGYDRITYEAMNSRYARGSAEAVADAAVALLRGLVH